MHVLFSCFSFIPTNICSFATLSFVLIDPCFSFRWFFLFIFYHHRKHCQSLVSSRIFIVWSNNASNKKKRHQKT